MILLLTQEQKDALNYLTIKGDNILMPPETKPLDEYIFINNEIDHDMVNKLYYAKTHPNVIEVIKKGEQKYPPIDFSFNSIVRGKYNGKYLNSDGSFISEKEVRNEEDILFTYKELISMGLSDELVLELINPITTHYVTAQMGREFDSLKSYYESPYKAIAYIFEKEMGEWFYHFSNDFKKTNEIFCNIWLRKAVMEVEI